MMLEFPRDAACSYLDRQYMLGASLLVAPVFSDEGEVSYYLPDGPWTRLLPALGSGASETVEGGRWIRETHGFMSLPLLARPNSIIAVGAVDSKPDYDHAEGVAFHLFEPAQGEAAAAAVCDLSGKTVLSCRAVMEGKRLSVEIEGRRGRCELVLHRGSAAPSSFAVDSGKAHTFELG